MRRRTAITTLATTALAGLTCALVAPTAATAMPIPDYPPLSAVRSDTITRAKNLLANPQDFRLSSGGTIYHSVPNGSINPLEINGSNANLNEFNGYNGAAWCGYFVARTWTGQNVPSASDFPRLPTQYPSSQAWRTDSGTRYHKFSANTMPRPADVLVWQDGSGTAGVSNGSSTGHVGVVISVDYSAETVTTIEGNVSGDSIQRKTYNWDADGPTVSGKHFMGYVDRE